MKRVLPFTEFVNESRINEMMNVNNELMNVKDSLEKIEQYAITADEDLVVVKRDYVQQITKLVKSQRFDAKSQKIADGILKEINSAVSLSSIVDVMLDTVEEYNLSPDDVNEAINWEKVGQTVGNVAGWIGNVIRKGLVLAWDKLIIPFVKYILNVLARLVVNIILAVINAVLGQTYRTPDATIFKKDEVREEIPTERELEDYEESDDF